MLIQTTGPGAVLRWLAAAVLALGPALVFTPAPAAQAAPPSAEHRPASPAIESLGPAAVLTTQFDASNYSASESAATAPFTVTLSAASAFTVTVVYATITGGTAAPGADYVYATGLLTITPGLTATQGAVTLLPDLLDETDETVFIEISNPTNALLGAQYYTRLSLLDDDDPPAVQWQTAAYTTTESAATAVLTATLSAPSGLTVTVSYTPTAGSATAGADYVAATGLLTFTPGLTATQAAVTLLPDLADEPDETFTVTLGSPANAALGAPSAAAITLLDDDALPTAQLSAALYGALESATTLPFTATLSAPSGLTVTVAYSTTGGTATPGEDYTPASGVLTFTPGSQSAQGVIALLPDLAYEPAETFGLALSAPSNATLGAPVTATVILADDDTPPTVQLTAAAYVAGEAGPTVPFTVTLSAASGLTITVAYTTTDTSPTPGSAAAGADYVAATGVLTFAPGLTTTLGALTLLPDVIYEPTETFMLALGGPSNATLGAPNAATLYLVEDDAPPAAQFSAANYSAGESSPTAPFTVTLSGPASLTVTVTYSTTADGTAAPGADYLAATGVLTFAPGLTSTQGALTLLPDALDEADETILLAITSTTIAVPGALDTTRLTIVDDDAPPTVQWSAAAYPATEGAGSVTLTATLSAPSALTVTVAYTSAPGTALPGSDYTPAAGGLTFTPGQTTQTVTLTLLADAAPEPAETLTLTLGSPVNAALGAPAAATLTIADDDGYALYLPLVIRPAAAAQGYHVGRMSK